MQEAEYEGEVLDSLEELDTIEELEAALQDYYDSIAYEDELEGELLRSEESEKQNLPPPLGKIVKLPVKEDRKPWGSDYDNYEDYYYEEDEVRINVKQCVFSEMVFERVGPSVAKFTTNFFRIATMQSFLSFRSGRM